MAEQKVKLTELPAAVDTIDSAQLLVNQNGTDQKLPITHLLRSKNNLADLSNNEQARANLHVPSVDEVNTQLAIYINGDKTFLAGATISSRKDFVWDEETKSWYYWSGPLPKDVPPASSPESTGGIGNNKWMKIGDDASLGPWLQVTANVVGTNYYIDFPGVGETITSGQDYLYNDVLYTTVGDGGEVVSVSGNVVTTTGGTAYLLDKRWPITDLRAWGVSDGDNADEAFANAATFLCRQDGTVRSLYVPPIGIKLSSVELRDMSNFNIHFDGTYVLGVASTSKNAMISVVNAVFFSITGNPIIESIANNYTYGIELKGGLPSLIAPLTGLLSNVCTDTIRFRRFPCAFRVGDGSDLQISEIQLNAQTNRCNCSCEVNGSQAIVSINGSLLCEPQQDFSYPKVLFNAIGGIIYQSSGETVASVDNDSVIAQIKQVSSSLYGNPFGSVKISCTHVECAGLLMAVDNNSGIVGDSDSKYSSVSFSNCQGSMLNGAGELIAIRVDPYEGTFSADETCNFYTSATRTARIVYSISSKFNFDVSPRSFRKGFNTLSSEIGSGNVNWIHNVQPIIKMSVNPVTIASSGTAPLGFSSREATGDYTFYFGDTTSGGIVLLHNLNMLNISISVPATGVLAIIVKLNGSEVFGCTNSGYLTLTKEMIPIGTVIEFEAKNGTGGSITTNAAARVIASASNIR